ncbi:hypothetical protein LEP1GSC049_2093 [Leptospira kirschneri serovar Cynopteri str. 3522 CT]|uniref:Uncharacterized protein n=1 Tax=Leptospira kirschneri str. 200802841 TaxID=1193047 RepID=A0A828Y412_9LEPT|nr:hypothetical protein LEP1GSC044_2508 [Leptospira kirschneri serovar Grippotyphosa str. RM52]EKO51563.1 hypothetical protein LEP1GSC131_0340 [Leptospira kirschneri str. 200802841]EKQ83421.1 hypothetical protein LEP1GSC064_2375 [Leptospira kirschneri serovar Grippotyphosa str. Moskva]EKR07758.1 hypothetical protein LEP1GSC122_3001 [Leptospira kirschneri serovar Valbuzzi str. 200702274]EMK07335.1 hypothetical protein LEP1GSC176_2149 [Leptospira kirschneri str. MMD1493]EMN24411.1 hypothetical p
MIFLLDYIGRLFNSPRKKLSLKTYKLDSNQKNFFYVRSRLYSISYGLISDLPYAF